MLPPAVLITLPSGCPTLLRCRAPPLATNCCWLLGCRLLSCCQNAPATGTHARLLLLLRQEPRGVLRLACRLASGESCAPCGPHCRAPLLRALLCLSLLTLHNNQEKGVKSTGERKAGQCKARAAGQLS